MSATRHEVHKFGGTSVGGPERLRAVASIIAPRASCARVVVVSSAMAGITDALVAAAAAAAAGEGERAIAMAEEIRSRHDITLARLVPGDVTAVQAELRHIADELSELLRATALLRELPLRTRDRILATGEKLAVRLLAAALAEQGVAARPLDADTFLETDGAFGAADPLAGVADRTALAALRPVLDRGEIAVVTGFCGRGPDGATTTLGRGGSDLTATWIGGVLNADEVTIWTDVDGVFSADPSVVPEARVVRHLNYREAVELSYYGAKVLHQRTMIPVVAKGIPVLVRNAMAPDAKGTTVDGRFTPGSHPVKAISAVRGQVLVSVEGKGMAGVPGVASRAFAALAERDVSATLITQSSAESSISLAVPQAQAQVAESALKRAFRGDLTRGVVEDIVVLEGIGLIAAVGLGMAHHPGVAARVFGALGARRVNVLAIAQGPSELNISLAVEERDVEAALRALHAEFGLDRVDTGEDATRNLDLIFLGCGGIGRALVDLLETRRDHICERFGLRANIVAVADRSGYLFRPAGLKPEELESALAAKGEGASLRSLGDDVRDGDPVAMVEKALSYRLSRPVLVDVSDADDSHEAFLAAFLRGCDVVTANKKPLAGPLDTYRELMREASGRGRVLKAEATVGAGLPVIDTLEMLLATGDRLQSVEGVLSGTLAFVMTRLEEGAAFSAAVEEAVARGYTEPDPVADLSGMDVARKGIIIGRLSGLVVSDDPVALEGLVDPALAGTPVEELLDILRRDYDEAMAKRLSEAAEHGDVLRFVARVESGSIRVGPAAVPRGSALGGLSGTSNMIVIHSQRYDSEPLVVTGPGAGVDVTAMGVLADILRIAAERG